MRTDDLNDFLRQLRSGTFDPVKFAFRDSLPAADFLAQIRGRYPVVFQERLIGRKAEYGLARSLQFEVAVPSDRQEVFPAVHLFPVFRRCLLISTYDDYVSGIAAVRALRVRPSRTDREQMLVAMASGYKLDKMPDGWTLKSLPRRSTVLSEGFLRSRGWQFDRLRPFAVRSR